MHQYFTLSAPNRMEFLASRWKMVESRFEDDAKAIVYLIAIPNKVPYCLPSQIVRRNNKQEERVTHEVLRPGTSQRVKLSTLTEQHETSNHKNAVPRVTFTTLPHEIQWLIFNHVKHIEDAICLGLSSRQFWQLVHRTVNNHYTSFPAPWAGKNIVCVGDYCEPADFPPGLFTTEEENKLSRAVFPYPNFDTYPDPEKNTPKPFALSDLAHGGVSKAIHFNFWNESYHINECCTGRGILDDLKSRSAYRRMVMPMTDSMFYSTQDLWVLRNLTTREFLRADTVALEPEFIHGPFIDGIGFGQVLLSRINWSSSSSTTLPNTGQIHRGVWAGHRFDIITLTQHQKQVNGVEWKDVGKDVMLEVAAIWQVIEGSHWRDIVTTRARKKQWGDECPA